MVHGCCTCSHILGSLAGTQVAGLPEVEVPVAATAVVAVAAAGSVPFQLEVLVVRWRFLEAIVLVVLLAGFLPHSVHRYLVVCGHSSSSAGSSSNFGFGSVLDPMGLASSLS